MALDISIFETINPSNYITFTITNPNPSLTQLIRLAVLDSPILHNSPPTVAAIFVPINREHDWVFSTESGQLELLLNSPQQLSRLILIGNQPNTTYPDGVAVHHSMNVIDNELKHWFKPVLIALSPNICRKDPNFEVPFMSYDDGLISSLVLDINVGPFVGEFLVEDVELDNNDCVGISRFRRRLRFKRMPNLVQTEVLILPECGSESRKIGEVGFRPDVSVLVHKYVAPMVASLGLISEYVEGRFRVGFTVKCLCLGVGGGALLGFLKSQLGFEVLGVEVDEEVLRIARKYFGLDESIRVCVGDAVKVLRNLSQKSSDSKFDVVMVDLDSGDVRSGVSAPPLEFVKNDVLLAAKLVLCESGIFVINVIPPNRSFYETLICDFREVFPELYEIDVGNGENFVLIATVQPIASSVCNNSNYFLTKLRTVISGSFVDSIRKV
ncbi:hypothetical protein ACFE04_001637 [Oxalis oulophora]